MRSRSSRSAKLPVFRLSFHAALLIASVCLANSAFAQIPSFYTGTLMIGFGDFANTPAGGGEDTANSGIPVCANTNPFMTATFATVNVAGFLEQGGSGGPAASLMLGVYSPIDFVARSGGGQAPIVKSTCVVQHPGFQDSFRVRSRVRFGSQVWPGHKFNAAGTMLTTGDPVHTVNAGGGLGPAGVPIVFSPANFYASMMSGMQTITPGPNAFGGAVPVNGGSGTQLGVNFPPITSNGGPGPDFGDIIYAEGFLPRGPAVYGTDASASLDPFGIRAINPYTWRVRTPGPRGTSGFPYGVPPYSNAIPLTENLGWSHGAAHTFSGIPLTTMGEFAGLFQKWTTGRVRHSDRSGAFTTERTATGFDAAVGPTSGPYGTTRRIQLVTPWSASIQKSGTGPFAGILDVLPDFGFGGVAVLTLDVTPVPEPKPSAAPIVGVFGLMVFAAYHRRIAC